MQKAAEATALKELLKENTHKLNIAEIAPAVAHGRQTTKEGCDD